MSKYEEALKVESALNELINNKVMGEQVELIRDFLQPIIDNEKEKEFKRQRDIKTSWGNFIPHREISKVTNTLSIAGRLYKEAREEISTLDRETQDILHSLELTDLNDEDLLVQLKDLQKIRIYRRKAKNFLEAVEPLHNFTKNNPDIIKKINKLRGEIDKVNLSIKERKYYPRVKTDLQHAFEKADHIYERMEKLKLV